MYFICDIQLTFHADKHKDRFINVKEHEIHREQEEMQSILLQNIQAYHAAKASFLTQFNNAKIQHRVHT